MSAKILAVDTATENCSVALVMGDQVFARSEEAPRDHTKNLPTRWLMKYWKKEHRFNRYWRNRVGSQGPGSFTGVRIGIGIAQGLAFGADLPMIGISTLAAMAQGSYRKFGENSRSNMIDARMSEVYWGLLQPWTRRSLDCSDAECVTTSKRNLAAQLEVILRHGQK